ncbi:OmpH family outer membrane protein [Thermodesulfobacterium hydrogeniphilum]|uniref:OmpH family outer membrane protein n=1 Tax=Thermodesulfobacterium hydrogeniphilum TaxID=161156 RepID=UPI00056F7CC2|nr:OmpH family outer membrane protein [Thermodesulfobacterium hydrogeniphilum]
MKKITFFYFFIFVFLFFTGISKAENLKIGVVDIKKVVNNSKYGQEVMKKLQKKYNELSAKIQAKAKELKALKDEIENKSSLWSQEVKDKKQAEYQKKLRELKSMQEDAQYEMQQYEKQMLDPVFKELEKVIKDFVEKENYDLILEKNQPGIYYTSSKIDLTSKIIQLFNKHYEEMKKSKK